MNRWLKIPLITLAVLLALVIVLLIGAYSYTQYLTTQPRLPEPEKPLLSWQQPLPPKPQAMADWEQVARSDQAAPLDLDAFANPSREYAPWTRWWWPGNVVTKDELVREVNIFAAQGYGGVELQTIAAGVSKQDMNDRRWREDGWDSPAYYDNVRAVLDEATQLGMRVDITAGSGWPSGGKHVGLEDGMQQLAHGETFVTGPTNVDMTLPEAKMPLHWRLMGFLNGLGTWGLFPRDYAELLTVVAARVTDNQRSANPLNIHDQVIVDPDSTVVLDLFVQDGKVKWQVPEGEWAIIAMYRLPGGETGGTPTYVVDHFNAERIQAHYDYLFRKDTGLKAYAGKPLRAFFNDSFEFKEERLWPRGQLQRFQQTYGYDPRPFLPAVVQTGHDYAPFHWTKITPDHEYRWGDTGQRFEHDWDEGISAAFIGQMLDTSRDWAEHYGLASRTQAYGFELDLIKAAGTTSIPETEQQGGSMLFMKMPSSGALLYDRPLVTAESFIHKYRAWLSTPAKVKAQAQQLFAAGVNQIIYHGAAYQVQDPTAHGYGEDGWYPFASSLSFSEDFSEKHPHWQSLQQVNQFISRQQYLMRLGKPEVDVLVYYPWLGFPLEGIGEKTFLAAGQFDGEPELSGTLSLPILSSDDADPREAWMASLLPQLLELERRGLTWQWVNPEKAGQLEMAEGKLAIGEQQFHALLLHDIDAVPATVAENISELASSGANIVLSGKEPARQPGLKDATGGDARVRAAFAQAQQYLLSMETLPAGPVQYQADHLQQARRHLSNGERLVFLNNTEKQARSVAIHLAGESQQLSVLDAWSGESWPLPLDNGTATVQVPAYTAYTLYLGKNGLPDTRSPAEQYLAKAHEVDSTPLNDWTLVVGDTTLTLDSLADWRTIEALSNSSRSAVYSTSIALDKADGERYQLELGDVFGTALVKVNGQTVADLIAYPFNLDITDYLHSGSNFIELAYVPPRRNAKVKQMQAQGGFGLGSSETTTTGILGPVRISQWQ
jgi:hypothetical protein